MDDAVGDAGASSNPTAPPLSLTARMQAVEHELQRFALEKGLDDDNDNESAGEDDLSWWRRHQFAYPTLARLANKYLAIPASSSASERVFLAAGNVVTKKRNKLGDDTVDALLVFLDGSHGLAWSRVKRNLTGGARQEGQVFFSFRVTATVGFASTYTSRSE